MELQRQRLAGMPELPGLPHCDSVGGTCRRCPNDRALRLRSRDSVANRPFSLMVYPNRNHSISGGTTRQHLFTLLTKFVEENLPAALP